MNSATIISTLLIVTISLLCSVKALRCIKCEHYLSSKICKTSEHYCETKDKEKCLLTTLSRGQKRFVGIQTCASSCTNTTVSIGTFLFQILCCDSHSFCNKPRDLDLSRPALLSALCSTLTEYACTGKVPVKAKTTKRVSFGQLLQVCETGSLSPTLSNKCVKTDKCRSEVLVSRQ
ncbi:hypothetical protein ACRRTK_003937 [Alexandromys fortis]